MPLCLLTARCLWVVVFWVMCHFSNERAGGIVAKTVSNWGMICTVVSSVEEVAVLLDERSRFDCVLLDYELDHPKREVGGFGSEAGSSAESAIESVQEEENAEEEHSLQLIQSPASSINHSADTHRVHSRFSTGDLHTVIAGTQQPTHSGRRNSANEDALIGPGGGGSPDPSPPPADAAGEETSARRHSLSNVVLPAAAPLASSVSTSSNASPALGSRSVSSVTGFDVSNLIRARHVNSEVPIIMLISLSSRQKSMRDVISIFLSLPLKYSKLYYALNHAVRKGRGKTSPSPAVAHRPYSGSESVGGNASDRVDSQLLQGSVDLDEMGIIFDAPAASAEFATQPGVLATSFTGEKQSPQLPAGHLRVNINTPNTNARTIVKRVSASQTGSPVPVNNSRVSMSSTSQSAGPSSRSDNSEGVNEVIGNHYPMRILVAEDNVINRKVISKMLARLGYNDVDLAENGRLAVDRVMDKVRRTEARVNSSVQSEKSGTDAEKDAPFDVVLMDLQMPVMDGLEATAAIRGDEQIAHHYQPFIIALTANAMQGDQDRCKQVGMDLFLTKPVTLQPLTQALKSAFNANLRKRVMLQADHIDLPSKHRHQRQISDTGSQSYSTPNSPESSSMSLGRAVSQASGMSASSLGTPLFPLLSSPHQHPAPVQDSLYRVSSAPGTLSCQSTATYTPAPQSPLSSFTTAQMTASLASSIAGSASAIGASLLASETLPTIYSPNTAPVVEQGRTHSAAG